MKKPILAILKNERGVSAIIVAVFILVVGIGIVAFVADIGYLNVVKNEIQNAADAGALAGANDLFLTINSINTGANLTAYNAATANRSGGNDVEVNWTSGTNTGDVQRGHWTFGTPGSFTANSNTTQVNPFMAGHDYNADTNFINAVKVVTHNTQIPSFFAKIWGHSSYQRTADAVAVRTVPGDFQPGDFDYPIAICIQSITDANGLNCNIGRMINSGGNEDTANTAGWTNFTQPCVTANASQGNTGAVPTGCGQGNSDLTEDLHTGFGMGSTGGQLESVYKRIRSCFFDPTTTNEREEEDGSTTIAGRDQDNDGIVDTPLVATLPVIDCPSNNVSNCATLLGAVNVEIVWMSEWGVGQLTVPTKMYKSGFPSGSTDDAWTATYSTDELNWASFVQYFNLKNVSGNDAPLQMSAIYFKPECELGEATGSGGTTGPFMGITSETSVLVE